MANYIGPLSTLGAINMSASNKSPATVSIPNNADPKLIFSDMDGTLLREDGTLPEGFWNTYKELQSRGIPFMPASGRQLQTLQKSFGEAAENMSFVAENGNMVVHNNEVVSATCLDPKYVDLVEKDVLKAAADGRDIGLVVCGHKSAYTVRTDQPFLDKVRQYYCETAVIPSLDDIPDKILKLAVFDFNNAELARPYFAHFEPELAVVVSSAYWIDIMDPAVNKGVAVRAMQKALGVTKDQTAAFGDYLNDLEMLDSAGLSFAMKNAHPDVHEVANHTAPHHNEGGVVQVINAMLPDDTIKAPGQAALSMSPPAKNTVPSA